MARAREDQLVPAAETRLKMRQHRADQDPQIGLGHRPENPHRNSLGRLPQIGVGGEVVHRRAEAAVAGRDRVAEPPAHRFRVDGRVTADPDADRHVFAANARRMQPATGRSAAPRGPASTATGRRPRSPPTQPGATWSSSRRRAHRRIQGLLQRRRIIDQRTAQVRPDDLELGLRERARRRQRQLQRPIRAPRHRIPHRGGKSLPVLSAVRFSRCLLHRGQSLVAQITS